MIILFEKNEKSFNTLGLGVLKDALNCIIREELNGSFELEMEYPIDGNHFSDIDLQKIILAKPNMYDEAQPFRIYSITKPINGRVMISAEHISYDMSGYIVKPFRGENLEMVLGILNTKAFPNSPFIFETDKNVSTLMETDTPHNLRRLLAGEEGSLLDIYKGEYKFNKFKISLLNNRGRDRGITIQYGKNLTNLENEAISSELYTGIFPFYSGTFMETTSITEKYYQPVYIVSDKEAFSADWLSLSILEGTEDSGGKPLIPLIENAPVQIKTAGIYFDKILYFKRTTIGVNYFDKCYIRSSETTFSQNWLSLSLNGPALIPAKNIIYRIETQGDYFYQTYIWNGSNYINYTGSGFYYIYNDDEKPDPPLTRITSGSEERYVYLDLMGDPNLTNGILIVEGQQNMEPQKILNLDLTSEFQEEPEINTLKEKAIEYLNNHNLQKIQNSLTVSFIKLSETEEYKKFKDLERVELGDWISVFYNKLGVYSKLQVISTDYDVLLNKYNEIELGNKKATITDSVLSTGDNISNLSNDAGYADEMRIVNLLVNNLTADYITGINAKLTSAQIKQLQTERIECIGIIEASEAYLDVLMAQLLVAENAEIKNKLTSGEIEVKGKITALSGEIGGCKIENGKLLITTSIFIGKNDDGSYNFSVDQNGNAKAKSLEIIGGTIKLGSDGYGSYNFEVTQEGKVTATDLTIKGGEIKIGGEYSDPNFSVDQNGNVEAKSLFIDGGEIKLGRNYYDESYNFMVDIYGNVEAKSFRSIGGSSNENKTEVLDGQLSASSIMLNDLVRLGTVDSSQKLKHQVNLGYPFYLRSFGIGKYRVCCSLIFNNFSGSRIEEYVYNDIYLNLNYRYSTNPIGPSQLYDANTTLLLKKGTSKSSYTPVSLTDNTILPPSNPNDDFKLFNHVIEMPMGQIFFFGVERTCYIVTSSPTRPTALSYLNGGAILTPVKNETYRILTPGTYYNKTYYWNGSYYDEYKPHELTIIGGSGPGNDQLIEERPDGGVLSVNGVSLSNIILNSIYPIGSIYISLKDISPIDFIGGQWTRLDGGMFLRSYGNATGQHIVNENNASNGGSSKIALVNLPQHTHPIQSYSTGLGLKVGESGSDDASHYSFADNFKTGSNWFYAAENYTNESDYLPVYKTVYMWRRVS